METVNRPLLPIETERLILRRFREADLEDLYAYLSRREVVQYEPYLPMSLEGCPGQPPLERHLHLFPAGKSLRYSLHPGIFPV